MSLFSWLRHLAPKKQHKALKIKASHPPKQATIWDAALATNAELTKGWDNAAKSAGLPIIQTQLLFKAANGACYYTYVDPLRIPVERHKRLEQSLLNMRLGLNEDYLDNQFIPLLKRASNLNDLVKVRENVQQLVEDFEARRKLPPTEKSLLRIACFFLLRHDEDPYTLNELAITQKLTEAANDSQLRAFFLMFALEQALALTPTDYKETWNIKSSSDFLNYLQEKAMKKAEEANGNR